MLVEKMMMPYVLASQHYMINLTFFITMLIATLYKPFGECSHLGRSEGTKCFMDYHLDDVRSVDKAFNFAMATNLISFVLDFGHQRIQIMANESYG